MLLLCSIGERLLGLAPHARSGRPPRALSEVGATKAIARRGNVGSACVRCEVTLERVTSGTILVLNNTSRDEAKQRLAILTFVEE